MAERSFVSRRKLNQPKIQPHNPEGQREKEHFYRKRFNLKFHSVPFTLLENVFLYGY
jgi:hypothetical protein